MTGVKEVSCFNQKIRPSAYIFVKVLIKVFNQTVFCCYIHAIVDSLYISTLYQTLGYFYKRFRHIQSIYRKQITH